MLAKLPVDIIVTDPRLMQHGLPQQATSGSAASDLRAFNIVERDKQASTGWRIAQRLDENKGTELFSGQSYFLDTGFRMHIRHPNVMGIVAPRSSGGALGVRLANTIGIIDADYQGPIILAVEPARNFTVRAGDRLAQIALVPVFTMEARLVTNFDAQTQRGQGGYGSTGVG